MGDQIHELVLLLHKISEDEDFVERAEQYYREHHRDWSDGVAAYFEIFLERKRDQILYEKERVKKMGLDIDRGYNPPGFSNLDI